MNDQDSPSSALSLSLTGGNEMNHFELVAIPGFSLWDLKVSLKKYRNLFMTGIVQYYLSEKLIAQLVRAFLLVHVKYLFIASIDYLCNCL